MDGEIRCVCAVERSELVELARDAPQQKASPVWREATSVRIGKVQRQHGFRSIAHALANDEVTTSFCFREITPRAVAEKRRLLGAPGCRDSLRSAQMSSPGMRHSSKNDQGHR